MSVGIPLGASQRISLCALLSGLAGFAAFAGGSAEELSLSSVALEPMCKECLRWAAAEKTGTLEGGLGSAACAEKALFNRQRKSRKLC